MDWMTVVQGIAGGLAYSFSGLANKPKGEKFDWKKVLPTFVISVVVGAVGGYLGQDYGSFANTTMALGITAFIQKAYSAVLKQFN